MSTSSTRTATTTPTMATSTAPTAGVTNRLEQYPGPAQHRRSVPRATAPAIGALARPAKGATRPLAHRITPSSHPPWQRSSLARRGEVEELVVIQAGHD